MAFAISFIDEPNTFLHDDPTIPSAVGRIVLGEYREEFVSILSEWDRAAYEAQWAGSLKQLLSGADRCVLITHFSGPGTSANLEWWAFYRGADSVVYVQNHMPWYGALGRSFKVEEASSLLKDRRTGSDAGTAISEWVVTLGDVEDFLNHACGGRSAKRT